MTTDEAINNLADVFNRLIPQGNRALYASALRNLVMLAREEMIRDMHRDFEKCVRTGQNSTWPR